MNEPSAPGPAPDPNPSATSPTELPTELPVEPTDARGGEVVEPTTRRRLERAPADRLAGADPSSTDASGAAAVAGAGSAGRALAMGAVGAVIGVTVYLILAIGFSFTAGLLVVAIFTARFIGLFVRAGAGASLSSAARVLATVAVFLVATTIAILITWLWSHVEGGDLGLADYLDQVYGTPLIALEFMLGTLVAWWSAR